MDIVQIINTSNQVFNGAGMSISGILADLETSRVLLTKGIMAGGFILQQKRGIYFFFAMLISEIFRSIKTFSQSGFGLNDARFFKFLKSIKSGFGRLIDRLGSGKPELVARYKGPDQDNSTVVIPITDSYWPKPWLR
jgi:hypothetical protein